MSAWVSLPQQWVMTTWNKQRSTLQWNHPRSEKLLRALNRFVFELPWLFLLLRRFCRSIGIMLFEFRLLHSPDILWNHASWGKKEEISRSTLSTSVLDSLAVELKFWNCVRSPAISCDFTSACCILTFTFIGRTSALKFLQQFFLV